MASPALLEQLQKMQAKRKSAGSLAATDDGDGDTASQLSISLSSAPPSPPPPPASPLPKSPESAATIQSLVGLLEREPEPEPEPEPVFEDLQLEPESDHEPEHELADVDLDRDAAPTPATTATSTTSNGFDAPRSSSASSLDDDDDSKPGLPASETVRALASPAPIQSPTIVQHPPTTPATYPPPPPQSAVEFNDAQSVVSFASTSSRKARPESQLIDPPRGPLVLGIALVDFHHLAGPQIEFYEGDVFEDDEIQRILPFLALPDGAHLNAEDYSYFHLVPSSPNPTTVFGISCHRQIATADLIERDDDMTRSTVQKAVVVLASKPLFGPIRDKLGVVTHAFFEQRNFHETEILGAFYQSLEASLRHQLTESALYMGTNLRELVHKFRHRTLLLLKALMLQKRIMFYGHPVERLCTYQYSLVSLIPGLLQTLDDAGSPPLAARAPTLSRPTSLKTSDRRSMLAYQGLPLDVFGKDAFFQPYLPLQQIDLLAESMTKGWLIGTTNAIVTQQKDIQLLVNIETNAFEFRDAKLERIVALTAADRKWIDEIVKDVNDTWNEADPSRPLGMQFKGSEDYIRTKFEEYISAALASVKYADFLAKGTQNGVLISDSDSGANALQDFSIAWVAEFRRTNAFEVWDRVTDPTLFDIVEPKHPCPQKPSAVADIGLRLQEGIRELQLEQQLAPTREALSNAFTAGSTNLFKAVEGVRGRWAATRTSPAATPSPAPPTATSPATETTPEATPQTASDEKASVRSWPWRTSTASAISTPAPAVAQSPVSPPSGVRPLSLVASQAAAQAAQAADQTKATVTSWGSGIGTFFSQRAGRFSLSRTNTDASVSSAAPATPAATQVSPIQTPDRLPRDELAPRRSKDDDDDDVDETHLPAFGSGTIGSAH
ncbi:hypothetical protein EXIGLDRAFT_835646 [Exidia glandulosa HHB12029]|uniref:UDENN domain-containing protein n=1 Tax=Exidia glandulosa HHB12029 TaxID=1314781 RepID=A0A166AMK7_EXIGL|nr:hypothetical protein EXIGLDRAFT_835646 [Exidia glandulosa HHB12029]